MLRFAALLDRLSSEPGRNGKLALLTDYFRTAPDPARGYALAMLTGSLRFRHARPAVLRALVAGRVDPVLFELSHDFVGDLSETVALIWPAPEAAERNAPPLPEVIRQLADAPRGAAVAELLAGWLDGLDETGRWALLKLVTGGLRVGVSARLAKTAVAGLGELSADDIDEVWHGLSPPYESLFAWAEGRAGRPVTDDPVPFRPPMLAHPLGEADLSGLDPADFAAEWKWDGIRVQAAAAPAPGGGSRQRLYSRGGEDITAAFPDLVGSFDFEAVLDGELLVVIEGEVCSFSMLQQRLNRKTVSARLLESHPAAIRAYDLLSLEGEDLRPLPFDRRRALLERFVHQIVHPRIDLSPLVPFDDFAALEAARGDPGLLHGGRDAAAIEGVMLKRRAAPYLPGRPKGEWYKWKRDPYRVDAVLMYAQRGRGQYSSFYSDYSFGVWREGPEGAELVPVGKACFGLTDDALAEIDRFVRAHTVNRFGPVREVAHEAETGLVLEVAFEGLNRSSRHKSGIAMRFPRLVCLRRDKQPHEADRLETLLALLPACDRSA
ncbi:cisplatin damage response ATP-dependent DNA ligase [Stappia indica]|uniref:cisplatin damage response ATP-dependent DNA ligase n=1 Tax=Stappia indica TaxID=538381 RepID=UPI001CD49940|nr:cisplatin damage response ATP-dependent DNA ligase [Stappia indica]MCA1297956.1 cisplatin damage response ATP-dependent DNA ligase [Stappia indica]